jgi:hypothetical protein
MIALTNIMLQVPIELLGDGLVLHGIRFCAHGPDPCLEHFAKGSYWVPLGDKTFIVNRD